MKLITLIVLVLVIVAGWFIVVPLVAPGVTEKTVVSNTQVMIGDACVLVNQTDLALSMYNDALKADVSDAAILKKKADVLAKTGRVSEAATLYQQVLSQDRNDTVALARMGDIRAAEGKLTEAISFYDAALAITPASGRTWLRKGDALMVISLEEDRKLRAVAGKPSSQLENMQSYKDALASYQKAMDYDPSLTVIVSGRIMSARQNQASAYRDVLNNLGGS